MNQPMKKSFTRIGEREYRGNVLRESNIDIDGVFGPFTKNAEYCLRWERYLTELDVPWVTAYADDLPVSKLGGTFFAKAGWYIFKRVYDAEPQYQPKQPVETTL